jgi:hypothetical protein
VQPQSDAPIPLSVFSVQVDPQQPTATFILQNTGPKTITAWHVSIAVGKTTSGKGADGYRSFAGLTSDASHIPPGATITLTAAVPKGAAESSPAVSVTPDCAIFDDKSFVGDAKFAEFVFQRRSAELAAWQQVTEELDRVRLAGVTVPALEQVLAAMDGTPQNNAGDLVRQTARTNLTLAIADIRVGRSNPVTRLNGLLDTARRNLAATRANSRE